MSRSIFLLVLVSFVMVQAQAQTPVPSSSVQSNSAPLPGSGGVMLHSSSGGNLSYKQLPFNYQSALERLEELRNLMPNIKAKDFQEILENYLGWLADMADGHWRIHQAFAKIDSLKTQAEIEKQSTLKLGQLKRQAMLLKAEFFIRENRQAEALAPLVDIVVAEPHGVSGEAAYSLLKQIGFVEGAQAALTKSMAVRVSAKI